MIPDQEWTPPTVLITFDDSRASIYNEAFPVMEAKGVKGTRYVTIDEIGLGTNTVTLPELQEMYAAGWDIANHTMTHPHMTTLSQADQAAEIEAGAAYLEANGMPRAARHMAVPYGEYNADTIAAAASTGTVTNRTVNITNEFIQTVSMMDIGGARGIDADVLEATARSWIDTATYGTLLCLVIHEVSDNPEKGGWSTTQFGGFLDYLTARGVRPITITQLYAAYQAGWTWA